MEEITEEEKFWIKRLDIIIKDMINTDDDNIIFDKIGELESNLKMLKHTRNSLKKNNFLFRSGS